MLIKGYSQISEFEYAWVNYVSLKFNLSRRDYQLIATDEWINASAKYRIL